MLPHLTSLLLLAAPTPPATAPTPAATTGPKASSSVEMLPTSEEEKRAPPPRPVATPAATVNGEDPETARKRLHPSVWVPASAGGALIAGGLVFYSFAMADQSRLISGDRSIESDAQVQALIDHGQRFQAIGLTMMAVGGAALTTACVLYYAGVAPKGPQVSFAPIHGGGAFTFGGTF